MAERLLPADLARQIPDVFQGPGYGPGAIAYARLVARWQQRRWYVTLYADGYCWTKYVGPEGAAFMGVHLERLEGLRGPRGERVEIDRAFVPRPLDECEPEMSAGIIRPEEAL